MAAGSTYTPIATQTLSSATNTVTFSSIPSTYTDLVVVFNGQLASNDDVRIRFNSDTGTNYSITLLMGYSGGAYSGRRSNETSLVMSAGYTANTPITIIGNLNNYSNTTTYKSSIWRENDASNESGAEAGLWRSTSAINSITFTSATPSNYSIGSTFTLYGITEA